MEHDKLDAGDISPGSRVLSGVLVMTLMAGGVGLHTILMCFFRVIGLK